MIKKTIEYVDYNGTKRKEDYRFNLTEAELTEMEVGTEGGYAGMVTRIVDAQDQPAIIKIFKELIFKAYGVVSDDGRRFMKSKELSEAFAQTEAYSILFMELATNAESAAEFINGIVPSDLAKKVQEQQKQNPALAPVPNN